MTDPVDDLLLGTDHAGQPIRVGDFRSFGYWTFLRLGNPTELGAALVRFLEEPTEGELRYAAYDGITPGAITEIKRNALRSGLDPATVLSAEFSLLELEDDNRRARDGIFDARQGRT